MKPLLHASIGCLLLCCLFAACGGGRKAEESGDSLIWRLHDTLHVGTLYSPTSYFLYKGDLMGYHYDLISKFAKDEKLQVCFTVMRNMAALVNLLDSGKIDIIAYNVPMTAEYKKRVRHCGPENVTRQVLVQPIKKEETPITDVTQLVGKEVYVEKGSKYESRLLNLNNELGGGIRIKAIGRDTLMAEDLIEMVAEGEIPLTVVDSDIAQLDHTYYENIDVGLDISFPQKSAWAVRKDARRLAETVDRWAKQKSIAETERLLFRHYFETSKISRRKVLDFRTLKHGKISEYDEFFKSYSKEIGWDWRLLAAQGYVESHFDPSATSWAGARGIMQLMPGTAAAYGLPLSEIADPESNIKAATKSIADLDKNLRRFVTDPEERIKFVLAAYNSGIAHIYDAIALAKKYGKNPALWHGNVSETLLMKANPEYYNDDVCKYGYFRGRQTVNYVDEVTRIYELFSRH